MAKKPYYLILLGLLLSLTLVACGEDKAAHLKSADMAKGYSYGAPVDVTSTFKPDEKIHLVMTLGGDYVGSKVKVVWTGVDTSDGAKNKTLQEKEFTVYKELDSYDLTPETPNGNLPTGKYKTEIFMNDKLQKSLEFAVQ